MLGFENTGDNLSNLGIFPSEENGQNSTICNANSFKGLIGTSH